MNSEVKTRKVALGIQYQGIKYSGWQSQPHRNTIQDHLEDAISNFLGKDYSEKVRVVVAGRTDASVHALGQVVHFETTIERDEWSWVRGINAFLPKDISVQWAKRVADCFDARFSAQERAYAYVLVGAPQPLPLLNGQAGYLMVPANKWLDTEAMQKAANFLIGTHDFSSFRSSECQSKTPIKTIYQLKIVDKAPFVYFFIRGNAFLHHMVRNIVGSLVRIGAGKENPDWLLEILNSKNRQLAAPTFSPDGLYFCRVGYPNEFDIPEPNLAVSLIPHEKLTDAFGSGNWLKAEEN